MNTNNIKKFYRTGEFAEILGVSVKTLQRWDRDGRLKSKRTPTNRRYYTYDQYLEFVGINSLDEADNRKTVIYARVSSRPQKDDLKKIKFLFLENTAMLKV